MFILILVLLVIFGLWCYLIGYQRGRDRCNEDSYIRGYNEGKMR